MLLTVSWVNLGFISSTGILIVQFRLSWLLFKSLTISEVSFSKSSLYPICSLVADIESFEKEIVGSTFSLLILLLISESFSLKTSEFDSGLNWKYLGLDFNFNLSIVLENILLFFPKEKTWLDKSLISKKNPKSFAEKVSLKLSL